MTGARLGLTRAQILAFRRRLSPAERGALAAEARSLPLPGITSPVVVRWA